MLVGRLTRTPETRNAGETAIARFTLAVDRRFKKQGEEQTADFISCVAFGKTAEFVEKYLQQGTKIACCGRIQTGSYTNKDGNKVYTTDVVIEEVEFAESKNTSGNTPKPTPTQTNYSDGFMNVPNDFDDLPFN